MNITSDVCLWNNVKKIVIRNIRYRGLGRLNVLTNLLATTTSSLHAYTFLFFLSCEKCEAKCNIERKLPSSILSLSLSLFLLLCNGFSLYFHKREQVTVPTSRRCPTHFLPSAKTENACLDDENGRTSAFVVCDY